MNSLFHLAFHVTDLQQARQFYGGVLGCIEGRSTDTWVDFDFFGHQLSLHLGQPFATSLTGMVGDKKVPMPHFGLVLALPDWQAMAERLRQVNAGLAPHERLRMLVVMPGEAWSVTNQLLTPTLKPRRALIERAVSDQAASWFRQPGPVLWA